MINYMKSEFFRILRGKNIFLYAAILSLLAVGLNILLFAFNQIEPNFPYGTIRFSFSNILSMLPTFFTLGAMVVAILFADNKKQGILGNSISFGLDRKKIIVSQYIISSTIGFIIMAIALIFYVGSALLLLEGDGIEALQIMLKGIAAILPSTIGMVVLAVALVRLVDNIIISGTLWVTIVFILPNISAFLGLRVGFFHEIARWMPTNILYQEVSISSTELDVFWNTPDGLVRVLVAGLSSIVLFGLMGVIGFRKKEV